MSSEQHSAPVPIRGVHPPSDHDALSLCFRSPLFCIQNFTFSRPFFYSRRPLISNLPPIFPVSVHFPTVFHVVLSIVSYSSNNELHVCNSEVVRFKESFIGRFTAQEDQLL